MASAVSVDDPLLMYNGSSVTSSGRRYLHANHQGSIIGQSNSSAVLLSKNSYDVYGIPADSNTGRFAYTGQIILPELEMYHYKARIYSPKLGRFLQTDPIGYEDQVNLYAYAHNNPYKYTDPDGREAMSMAATWGLRIGGGITMALPIPGARPAAMVMISLTLTGDTTANNESSSDSSGEKENKGQTKPEVGDCPTCGGDTSNKPGKIGSKHGLKPKDVKGKIHGLKGDAKISGNPDVEVCNDCGEVFPQTDDGGLGDSIGNIDEEL